VRGLTTALVAGLAAAFLPAFALAQNPPVVIVSPPPDLVRAGPPQGGVVSPADQALASKGAKPFAPLTAMIVAEFDNSLADYPSARFKDVSFGY